MPNPVKKRLASRLARKFDETQRVWHGTSHEFSERALDSDRSGFANFDDVPGTYFAKDRPQSETYMNLDNDLRLALHPEAKRTEGKGMLLRAEVPADKYLLNFNNRLDEQSPIVQGRLADIQERYPYLKDNMNYPLDIIHEAEERMMSEGTPGWADLSQRHGIPGYGGKLGAQDAEQMAIWSPNDFRVLGRSAAVGGAGVLGAMASEDAEAGLFKGAANKIGKSVDDWLDIYHGSPDTPRTLESTPMWAHTDPEVANTYAQKYGTLGTSPNLRPMKLNTGRMNIGGQDDIMNAAVRQGLISQKHYDEYMDANMEMDPYTYIDKAWNDDAHKVVSDLSDQGFDAVKHGDYDMHGNSIESLSMLDPRRLNDVGILKGKFTDKLAVAGTGGVMADDNWSFIEESAKRRQRSSDARSLGRLEEINREGPSIYGPEHPRLLGGLSAVRNLPGADFLAGGLFDVAEDYAYGDESTTEEKIMAGLDIGGVLPIGAAAGMIGKGIGRGIGRFMGKADSAPTNKYGIPEEEYDSVIDAIRQNFGETDAPRQEALEHIAFRPDEWQSAMERATLSRERTPLERINYEKYTEDNPLPELAENMSIRSMDRIFDSAIGRLQGAL